jgi:hypothetical protein
MTTLTMTTTMMMASDGRKGKHDDEATQTQTKNS